MARRHERTRARRCALQVLYTSEIQGAYPSVVTASERLLSEDGDLPAYAQRLAEGVEAHQAEIDHMLASSSENWSLARMPIVDRSILRLAVFEMAYIEDVPISVTINEAVELAKDFGGEDESPRFVNGVLGRIATHLEERAANADGSLRDEVAPSMVGGVEANAAIDADGSAKAEQNANGVAVDADYGASMSGADDLAVEGALA